VSNGAILVTGATGFVGSHVVDRLLELGETVRVTVRATSNLRWLEGKPVEKAEVDLRTPEGIGAAVAGTRAVLHFAGRISARSKEEFFAANVEATGSLIQAFAAQAPRDGSACFLYCSSLAAGGPAPEIVRPPFPHVREEDAPRPVSDYGASKLAGEQEVTPFQDRVRVVIFRPPAIYGPRDTGIFKVFKYIERGWVPIPRRKGTKFSLIHVEDLAEAAVLALRDARAQGVYYLSDGAAHSWEDVVRHAASVLGVQPRVVRVPLIATAIGGVISELVAHLTGRAPLISRDKIRELRQKYWVCLPAKATRDFGFTPRIEMSKGVEGTLQWYLRQGWLRAAR
jgi:nucleoside-diphosphate-sugar epimerase